MKTLLLASLAVTAVTALSSADTVTFDNFKTRAAPPGWMATQTGSGSAKWSVEKDDSAPGKPNVLKQSGEATFPVCIKNDTNLKDGFVEVKFKPIAGKEDQAGGVIWRVQDANNYYISRANALEDNVTIYHTINGKRVAFKSINTKVTSGAWHTLRVDFAGNKFTVTFDGNKVIDATDESFANAGKVGVWTKADSVTEFDNVTYDDASKRIYVGFGSGGIGIISASEGKIIGALKLPEHPESFELEKQGHCIFVNVPNARQVVVIDREKSELIATWKTDGAFGNFPMAFDEANHRLFIGCRAPPKLVVLNTESGNVVASIDISGDPDDVFYDRKRHRIYAICGAGKIGIIEQADANTYKEFAKIDTATGARTGLFVPERDSLFVGVPHRGSQAAEIRCYQIE